MFTKEMLANIRTIFRFVVLIFTIDGFHHDSLQHAFFIAREQFIPVGAPNHFDDIPTSATEIGFKFLNDLAIATHRSI